MRMGLSGLPGGDNAHDIGLLPQRKGGLGRTHTAGSTMDVLNQDQ
jgi:hypothetical protein